MATHYAWSRFKKEVNEWGKVTKWINPGEKISQKDLDLSDREWESLIAAGAVREESYPDIPNHMSPAEYFRAHPEGKSDSVVTEEAPAAEVASAPADDNAPDEGDEEKKPGWLNK